jgi:hypothetical protein
LGYFKVAGRFLRRDGSSSGISMAHLGESQNKDVHKASGVLRDRGDRST